MTASSTIEQRAIAALARHVSAPWQKHDVPPSTTIMVAGRRIAVAVATVPKQDPDGAGGAKARLRDDRVARRFLSDLESAIGPLTPDGKTVILTLSAPIKVPNQLLAALTAIVENSLDNGAVDVEESMDILGNRVRFRILSDGAIWTSRAVAFVFSGDPRPGDLARAMRALRDAIIATANTCGPDRSAGASWLVLACSDEIADLKTYRRAFSRLSVPDRFEKILLFDRSRVELLLDRRGVAASR